MFTWRRLPHLSALEQPVFVTFRLADSLPANRAFPRRALTNGRAFVAVDRLLDQARSGPMCLNQPAIAQVVADSIHRGQELNHYDLHAWVIMPNHVHLLITPHVALSSLLRSLKTFSAIRANALLDRTGHPFWQEESYDHLVRTAEEYRRIHRYIENNPLNAGLCTTPEAFPWSSAR
jgi:putative DNA methylase